MDIYYLPFEIKDSLSGKRDKFTPPRRLIFIGGGDFRKIGDEFFKYFVELGGLKPDHKVLDVGCGIGRMAVPLTKFLTNGSYEGFDIVHKGIKWSNKTISTRYPNFRFQLADVYNKLYNPSGKHIASEYRFPYTDESFDFVFLTSVFTHMLPRDLNNYFSEIIRVLKPKGKAFITYFLINGESRKLISQNLSRFEFKLQNEGYWTTSHITPESAIAYEEEYMRNLYKTHGMMITEPIQYGSWPGRKQYLSFQDIVIAEKNNSYTIQGISFPNGKME
jgi:ubiquinone/menaquinone biosynthesis C-methylase UbiE